MGTVMNWKVVYIYMYYYVYLFICIYAYYVLSLSLYFSLSLCTHIWVNYYNLTVTSLESWLVRGIIPKWPYFRRRVDNVPRAFVFFSFCFQHFCCFVQLCLIAPLLFYMWMWLFSVVVWDGVGWDVNAQLKLIPVLMLWWWGSDGVGWGRVEIDSSVDATVMMW